MKFRQDNVIYILQNICHLGGCFFKAKLDLFKESNLALQPILNLSLLFLQLKLKASYHNFRLCKKNSKFMNLIQNTYVLLQ